MQANCVKTCSKVVQKSVYNLCLKNVDKFEAGSFLHSFTGFSQIFTIYSHWFYTWFLKVFHLKKRSFYTFYTQLIITTKYIKEGKEEDES